MPCDNDFDRYEQIKNFLLDDKGAYIWHHKPGSGFDFKDVSKGKKGIRSVVFYRHLDLRAQVIYGRITKEQHLVAAGEEAREKKAKRKTVEEFKVKGFKDVWPFDRLPYSDLARNSSPPPCHAMSGMIKRCVRYMLGVFKEKKPARRIYANAKKIKCKFLKKKMVVEKDDNFVTRKTMVLLMWKTMMLMRKTMLPMRKTKLPMRKTMLLMKKTLMKKTVLLMKTVY
jgi:hypothetical protein